MYALLHVTASPVWLLTSIMISTAPSGSPYNLMVDEVGSSNISLSWTEPDQHEQNGMIRHFLIYLIPTDSSSLLVASTHITSSSFTSYSLSGLHPYTSYNITVAAVTVAPGPNSTEVLVQTEEDSKP